MKTMFYWSMLLVVLPFFLISCAVKTVSTTRFGSPEGCERRLLIASEFSEFKSAVIQQLTRDLNDDACYLKTIDIGVLGAEPAEAYDSIVILNSLKYFKINSNARSYLDQTPEKQKFVMLVTTGKKGKTVAVDAIDAVSSASTLVNSEMVAGQMVTRIRSRFDGR
jgi:hypothetical protein